MAGSSKYWEKRALEREARWTDKCQKEIEQEMARYYAASIREIEKDILVLYGRFAMDNGLSMRDARTLLHGQEFRDWRMGMKEYLAEIKRLQDAGQISESRGLLRELNTLAMRSRITVLDKLRSETLRELDSLGHKTETAMGRFLGDAYKDAYYRSVFDIGKEGMFRGSFSKVDSKQVENVLRTPWSGKNYSERIWKDMQKLESTIQDVVTQGIHRGLSAQKMTQKVMERMNVSQSNAERLVRTEMNYAQNQAALEGIKDAGLMYYCFVAVMDRRTTPICREHDGEVFPVEEARAGSNVPPLHPRCRSTIIASLDEEGTGAKGGRRVSRGSKGQNISIPAEMKYSDWKAVYVDKSKTWAEWKQETG
ncbi:MAG: minor capsid protein, partial [Selenomonadaceae bacterium]|nr:minor capsid protein [Selenomonadaceae bacterium]